MRRFSFEELWRERGGALTLIAGLLFVLILLPVLVTLNSSKPAPPTPGPNPTTKPLPDPTVTPSPAPLPTATPTLPARTARLNPQHGIHAPIGGEWTDTQRQALAGFQDENGQSGAPGLVLALTNELTNSNNSAHARMEEDLHQYERQGAEIYLRLYPQRFPGGLTEKPANSQGRNTISGTPRDVAQDIFEALSAQQRRNGWHFSRIIPGNEPDIEWPNALYAQNVLLWQSNGDPAKYSAINQFFMEIYRAWQERAQQPDAATFRDVVLYFPALAQDAAPGPDFYATYNFYDGTKPVGNRYDRLREAIELYGRFSWHNYFQPGRACQDLTATAFPDWLKAGLMSGWPAVVSEAGWSPGSLALPTQDDAQARFVRFWQKLGLRWEKRFYTDDRPQWLTQDDLVGGQRFEDDLAAFVSGCYRGGLKLKQPVGVAVWLAGSEGNFIEALGVEPGPAGPIRRWLRDYAQLHL